jgi:predicted nucleic acid-binding protein
MLAAFLGVDAQLAFLDDVIAGAFTLEPIVHSDLVRIRDLLSQYRDRDLGLADAAVIATAERLGCKRLLAIDQRDFRSIKPLHCEAFVLAALDEIEQN